MMCPFSFKRFIYFSYLCVCLSVHSHTHVCMQVPVEGVTSLELELHVVSMLNF